MSKFETNCIRAGWQPKNGEPLVMPVIQSTTFKFDNAQSLADLFDLKAAGHFYSRVSNPSCEAVENKIAALEGGAAAMVTSSGQAANATVLLTLLSSGDHVVSSNAVYGGSFNLLNQSLKQYGITCTMVPPNATEAELAAAVKPNTKLIFGEVLANPQLSVLDIATFAKVAHQNGIPLVVDNTLATPYNCQPISHGADIVTHSASKYLDGHATVLSGVIVDSGNFDWSATDKFPSFNLPDETYHGLVPSAAFGNLAFIYKARLQIMRDFGMMLSAQSAFLLSAGIDTLALRMQRHNENALAVAKHLEASDKIAWVNYPKLDSSASKATADKYLTNGASGVVSFGVKAGKEAAMKLMDAFKLVTLATHVADIRTMAIHPASTTHRQLSDADLTAIGVNPDMVRLSVGIEHIDDILADIDQALNCI